MNDNIIPLHSAADEPQPFDFNGQPIRVVTIDGEPWFVLADACKVLGLTNPSMAAEGIDADALSSAEVIDSMGRTQTARITDESGIYALAFKSRKDEAKAFTRWVTKEVLPAIRKTGSYGAPALPELSPGDWARLVLQEETEKKEALAQLEAAQPAVEYVKQYVGNDDAVTVEAWGAQYGLTRPQAFDLLRDKGFIRRHALGDHWSTKRQRIVTDHEHRAVASKTSGGQKTYNWFTLRPQHNVPRRHNGQVRQTLYIRQAHGVDLAKACGLISKESNDA